MTPPACFPERSAGSPGPGGGAPSRLPTGSGPRFRCRAVATVAALCLAGVVQAQVAVPGDRGRPAYPAPQAADPVQVAQADSGGPRWAELNPGQRQVLAPLANDWNTFDARSKERWLGVASRFHQMPPQEQQRANERMVQWAHMSPQQRSEARLNFQELRSVSKEERQARWQAYQALPEEQKRALAQQAAAAAVPPSAASAAAAAHRKHPPLESIQPKTNVVTAAKETGTPIEPGSPVLEMRPGATTTLVNRHAAPPAHQKVGQPKINAGPNYVDRTTLLPKRGAQATGNGASTNGQKQR